jgi:DNA-binding transcriptional LysR family regulator
MLDVRRLHVLLEVARHGSISGAAAAMNFSPSALSQQIFALEREVGMRVLERDPRGVALTEAGEILVRHTEAVVAQLAVAKSELDALAGVDIGTLRMGWFSTAGAVLVPQAINAFLHQHPGVTLQLTEADPDDCVALLRVRELELALLYRFELEPPLPNDIHQVALLEDPTYVALPLGHRLADRDEIRLPELAEERWIQGVRKGPTVAVLPQACRRAGFEPVIAFQTDDHLAVQGFVAAGVGIALVPEITLPAVRSDIVVRPIAGVDLRREVRAAVAPSEYRSPSAEAMLAVLQEVCQQVRSRAELRLRDGPAPSAV